VEPGFRPAIVNNAGFAQAAYTTVRIVRALQKLN